MSEIKFCVAVEQNWKNKKITVFCVKLPLFVTTIAVLRPCNLYFIHGGQKASSKKKTFVEHDHFYAVNKIFPFIRFLCRCKSFFSHLFYLFICL